MRWRRLDVAEKRLLAAVAAGRPFDARGYGSALGALADSHRTIRARVLAELLTSERHSSVSRMTIRGARIVGKLDLEAANLICALLLEDCYFDEPIDLTDAHAPSVRIHNCDVPAIMADRLVTQRDLHIAFGTQAERVHLSEARIGGSLLCDGARLGKTGSVALAGWAMTVAQSMSCSHGFAANGTIQLIKARIGTSLSFTGATLRQPGGLALDAQGIEIGYALFLGRSLDAEGDLTVDGGIRLVGARIDGFVCCWRATINNPGDVALNALGLIAREEVLLNWDFRTTGGILLDEADIGATLNLDGARLHHGTGCALSGKRMRVSKALHAGNDFFTRGSVNLAEANVEGPIDFTDADLSETPTLTCAHLKAHTLLLRPRQPPKQIDLRHATIGLLADSSTSWPAVIQLRNFTYTQLENTAEPSVRNRIRWLRRDPAGYQPQPYEQLATVYRRAGHDEAANKTTIAKFWHQRSTLNPAAKLWNWLLYLTVGYGYRTHQAALWLLVLLLVGSRIFSHAGMQPTRQPPPAFNAHAYTADLLIPVLNLGQRTAWQPQGAAIYWTWTFTALGWLLTTAVIAGITRLLKPSS